MYGTYINSSGKHICCTTFDNQPDAELMKNELNKRSNSNKYFVKYENPFGKKFGNKNNRYHTKQKSIL